MGRQNFTEFCEYLEDTTAPMYEADGIPRCPPGYIYDRKKMDCVPKTEKDKVNGRLRDNNSGSYSGATYNVFGVKPTDGYAIEDGSNLNQPKTHSHEDGSY